MFVAYSYVPGGAAFFHVTNSNCDVGFYLYHNVADINIFYLSLCDDSRVL